MVAVFDREILVKQTSPQQHGVAREVGVDLIRESLDYDPGIHARLAAVGVPGKGANRSQLRMARQPAAGRCRTRSCVRL
jgi:hypothetical protein